MVEIKTFIEIANNVNKVGKGGGGCTYPITYKHGFAGFLPSYLGELLVYHYYFHIRR